MQEIYQPITRRRGYFVAGKFDLLQQNVPFSALVNALQDLVQQLLTEGEEEIAAGARDTRGRHAERPAHVDVVPALELIIGPQPRVPQLDAARGPEPLQPRVPELREAVLQEARTRCVAAFLDDMQWADSASLNLITLIVSASATESLLLVLTYRDEEMRRDASAHARRQGATRSRACA